MPRQPLGPLPLQVCAEAEGNSATGDFCGICDAPIKDGESRLDSLSLKAYKNIIKCSKLRDDGRESHFISNRFLKFHTDCRRRYIDKKSIASVTRKTSKNVSVENSENFEVSVSGPRVRSSDQHGYQPRLQCIYCAGKVSVVTAKAKSKSAVHRVTTLAKEKAIRDLCCARGDTWAEKVQARLATLGQVVDLVAAGAVYHGQCDRWFTKGSPSPPGPRHPAKSKARNWSGRPSRGKAFQKVRDFLEANDECQFSMKDLATVGFGVGHDPSLRVTLRKMLVEHYGEMIMVTKRQGMSSIINFRETVDRQIYSTWLKGKTAEEEETAIVIQAAKILRNKIKSTFYDCTKYASPSRLKEHLAPPLLLTFLTVLFSCKSIEDKISRKINAISQTIIAAVRPRSFIPSLLIAAGLQIHCEHASKLTIDTLHALGLISSYTEIIRYKKSAMKVVESGDAHDDSDGSPKLAQWVSDNADANVKDLLGKNDFHCLGNIEITEENNFLFSATIPRLTKVPTAAEINAEGQIPIQWYPHARLTGLKTILMKPLNYMTEKLSTVSYLALDCAWMCGRWVGLASPSWNGFMSQAMRHEPGSTPHKPNAINILPFVKLDPSNLSAVYSALLFIKKRCEKAKRRLIFTTFDQPLYCKAMDIVAADTNGQLLGVVPRLGGFHTCMAFLAAIGTIMDGTGLEELWCQKYGPLAAGKMMKGKAYARALRAHFHTQECLAHLLFKFSSPFSEDEERQLGEVHTRFLRGDISTRDVANHSLIRRFLANLIEVGDVKARESRTGAVWWQYFELVTLLRLFIRAERTGDWKLHLYVCTEMVLIFLATGHHFYAKATHVYVQTMEDVMEKVQSDPLLREEGEAFFGGYFAVRQQEKQWAGKWTDFVIENVLMRRFKLPKSGVTTGRGMSDSVLMQWLLSLPCVLPMLQALEEYTGVRAVGSEQHVECRESRGKADRDMVHTFRSYLEQHNPFIPTDGIRNIATGVTGGPQVNCDKVKQRGRELYESVLGKVFTDTHVRRKECIISLATDPSKSVNSKAVDEDFVAPDLLIMRMALKDTTADELRHYLSYELYRDPLALFAKGLMRKNTKSDLRPSILSEDDLLMPQTDTLSALDIEPTVDSQVTPPVAPSNRRVVVVDGGWLLHAARWNNIGQVTFGEIATSIVNFLTRRFGSNCIIVFDGYGNQWSTKQEEQRRREKNNVPCPDILVQSSTRCTVKQDRFLTNSSNKIQLIDLLKEHLHSAGHQCIQANADADVRLVETALQQDIDGKSVDVVATDTDVLVMLVARAKNDTQINVIFPEKVPQPRRCYSMRRAKENLKQMCDFILLAHAFSGCDTCSAIFMKGKVKVFNLLKKDSSLRAAMQVFMQGDASQEEIIAAGETLMLRLYTSDETVTSLNELRFMEFHAKGCGEKRTALNMALLPPTSEACAQHSLRVYLQVQEWLGNSLSPTEWGWERDEKQLSLVPVKTRKSYAPPQLIEITTCGCKSGMCAANTNCKCRRAGNPCATACHMKHPEVTCTNTSGDADCDSDFDDL